MLFKAFENIFGFTDIYDTFIIGIVSSKQKVHTAGCKIIPVTAPFYIDAGNLIGLAIPVRQFAHPAFIRIAFDQKQRYCFSK